MEWLLSWSAMASSHTHLLQIHRSCAFLTTWTMLIPVNALILSEYRVLDLTLFLLPYHNNHRNHHQTEWSLSWSAVASSRTNLLQIHRSCAFLTTWTMLIPVNSLVLSEYQVLGLHLFLLPYHNNHQHNQTEWSLSWSAVGSHINLLQINRSYTFLTTWAMLIPVYSLILSEYWALGSIIYQTQKQ